MPCYLVTISNETKRCVRNLYLGNYVTHFFIRNSLDIVTRLLKDGANAVLLTGIESNVWGEYYENEGGNPV